jgi:fructose-1,6-bisphosphatase/inositol monophosphatase family enzyme
LAGGKFLKDDGATLAQQTVKSSSKILLLRKPVENQVVEPIVHVNNEQNEKKRKQMQEEEDKVRRIKRIRAAAEELARRQDGGTGRHDSYHLTLTDQNGRPVKLPEHERFSLLLALTLHEKVAFHFQSY